MPWHMAQNFAGKIFTDKIFLDQQKVRPTKLLFFFDDIEKMFKLLSAYVRQ